MSISLTMPVEDTAALTAEPSDALAAMLRGPANEARKASSNGIARTGGFWETGREQADGAITGTVWKPWAQDKTRVVKAGSFRIEPDGRVSRFPGTTPEERAQAYTQGQAEYTRLYGPHPKN